MSNIARFGDSVLFKCGIRTIVTGGSKNYINSRPNARLGDKVSCGGVILSGKTKYLDSGKPVSTLGDKAICPPPCKTGVIISGALKDYTS